MKLEDINKVAIYGAGTMGPGLAQVFASAGYDVTMYSRKEETLEKALRVAKANLATFVEQGLLSKEAVPSILARIKTTQSVAEAAVDADFVIESIAEKLDAKQALYEKYSEYFAPMRERRKQLIEKPQLVEDVLQDGAARARKVARQTIQRVRQAVGLA